MLNLHVSLSSERHTSIKDIEPEDKPPPSRTQTDDVMVESWRTDGERQEEHRPASGWRRHLQAEGSQMLGWCSVNIISNLN